MTKPVIVTRLGKGAELTFAEGDANFTNLRDATINVSGDSGTTQSIDLNGTITVAGGTGVSTEATPGTITINGFSGSYTDLTNKPTIPTNNNELTNGAGYITGIISGDVTTALGFTPENNANKNAINGYAGLDASGKVAAAQLPSYVDDVLEAANFAALPATGETGKIYITLDTNKVYRWSGSAYIEIVASPGSTDEVTEGATNLYFTQQRARDAFSAGTNISITNGEIAVSGTLGIVNVTEDTSPSLGGDLDMNGFSLIDTTSSTVNINGFAYGGNISVIQSGTVVGINAQDRITLNDTGANLGLANGSTLRFSGSDVGQFDGNSNIGIQSDVVYYIAFPFGTSVGHIALFQDEARTISVGNSLDTNYTITAMSWQEVSVTTPSNGDLLAWNGTAFTPTAPAAAGFSNVVEDQTPQLGGDLDVNGNSIVNSVGSTVNINGFAYGGNISEIQSGTVLNVQAQDRLTLNDTGANLGLANGDKIRLSGTSAIQYNSGPEIEDGVVYSIGFPFGTGQPLISLSTFPGNIPVGTGMVVGSLSGVTWQEVEVVTPANGDLLAWDGTAFTPTAPAAGGIANVVEDVTPQLGGNLDGQGNTVSDVNLSNYKETNFALTYAATITPDVANGNVQTITLTGNVTFNAFANPEAGQSMTLIIKQDATGSRTLTSTMKFAGGDATLSTDANSVDIMGIFYDGTDYYASLSTGFATPA